MRLTWFGHAAFRLDGEASVVIDPFGQVDLSAKGWHFGHQPLAGLHADVVLVTHEDADHNFVAAIEGTPQVIRSTAGTFASPLGDVVAIASEHDDRAGTVRGPNTIFRFTLDGVRICHLGDFGQAALRPEQREAIGELDLLLVPVGGAPTLGGEGAAQIVRQLRPRLAIPMHYRTPQVDFLQPADEFLDALGAPWLAVDTHEVDAHELLAVAARPTAVLLAPPPR